MTTQVRSDEASVRTDAPLPWTPACVVERSVTVPVRMFFRKTSVDTVFASVTVSRLVALEGKRDPQPVGRYEGVACKSGGVALGTCRIGADQGDLACLRVSPVKLTVDAVAWEEIVRR